MTRDQAIEKVLQQRGLVWTHDTAAGLIDSLIALDILKVETPRQPRDEAIAYLSGASVYTKPVNESISELTRDGARDIIESLECNGFKVTR